MSTHDLAIMRLMRLQLPTRAQKVMVRDLLAVKANGALAELFFQNFVTLPDGETRDQWKAMFNSFPQEIKDLLEGAV